LGRPDVPVFPPVAEVHLGLRLPSPGVADSHRDAVNLWDADRDAVRRACFDIADAIPEALRDRLGLPDRMAGAAERLAGREPRLADAVPDHPDLALAVCLELLALVDPAGRWAEPRVAAAPCIPDAVRSEA
jgi:hypothetical protein